MVAPFLSPSYLSGFQWRGRLLGGVVVVDQLVFS